MFKTNYQARLIEKGDYEVIIVKAELLQAETGTKYMNLSMKIREDVEQDFQGEMLYERLWQNKTTGEYNLRRFNNICKSAGIPEGTNFENENEFLKEIEGKVFQVNVAVVYDDYRQEDVNTILYYHSTEKPFKTAEKAVKKAVEETIENDILNDDELPW